jgi:hypothetical protein
VPQNVNKRILQVALEGNVSYKETQASSQRYRTTGFKRKAVARFADVQDLSSIKKGIKYVLLTLSLTFKLNNCNRS